MDQPATPPQVMQTSPWEFKDFSGGVTDFYLGCALNRYQKADNLLIQKFGAVGKLYTRPGSQIHDSTYYQIPAGAQRINSLKYFQSVLFYQSSRKFYYVNSGWVTLNGPTGNFGFPTGVDTNTVVSMTTWNGHLIYCSDAFTAPGMIYNDGSTWQLRTAGMPPLVSAPTVTAGAAGANNYLYRFLNAYTYTVGTRTFIARGHATEVALASAAAPDASAVAISAIPVVANGATTNYDTSSTNLVQEIYRTINGGADFFLVGNVANGTTTFSDSMSDATLVNQQALYTEGGAPDNDTPPPAKVVHVVEDRGFYANVTIGGVAYPSRIYQSIPGAPLAVPATFFHDCRDNIVAISSIRNIPVALGEVEVYRLDDGIDELGRGDITPATITPNGGCVSALSVVQTPEGVWWAGTDGFWFTDGFSAIRISGGIRKTYATLVATTAQQKRIVGKYDSDKKRIYWTVQSTGATDCDTCFVLDLNWGLSEDMPFTTISGGANFAPTALEFIGTTLVRGDTRGYAFDHLETLYTDPKVDTTTAPTNWNLATLVYDHISAATDFGSSFMRKWVPRMSIDCDNETNLSLQINSINDNGRKTGALSPIRFRGLITWGDADVYWGDPNLLWNYQGLVDEGRRMPAQSLRCEYKQLELTNAKVAIVSSDVLGVCDVDASAKTATLQNVALAWPSAAVDYVIAFEHDNYSTEFTITQRTDTTLTFADASSLSFNATGSKWVIRGKPKGETLRLISYTMHYAFVGKTQNAYHTAGTGEVGSS